MVTVSSEPLLTGKTALVTGAARRVGASIARTLHAAGAQVVLHCHRSLTEAQQLAAELESQRPGSTSVIACDLLDVENLPQLLLHCRERFGGLDLLVNNASSFYPTPLGAITLTQWNDLVGTNLRAPLFLAQAAAQTLRQRHGLIVNIVDIHGKRPLGEHTVYSVAKAGLIMLTQSLARELAPQVRVNAVAPGAVLWPESGMDPQRRGRILDATPLHHPGSPEDVARAVLFFATAAPFVTGQTLAVDGGRSIGW